MGVVEYSGQEALDVADVIALEQKIANEGTPLFELMQRAGSALADVTNGLARPGAKIVIFAGSGNNGGDGWVAARILGASDAGYDVTLVTTKTADEITAEPAHRAAAGCMEALEGEETLFALVVSPAEETIAALLDHSDVVIDAMLGTGFAHDEVREPMGSWIRAIDEEHEKRALIVISADCPSGLNAQTGDAASTTVQADITVTMLVPKTGLFMSEAAAYVGKLLIAPLLDERR